MSPRFTGTVKNPRFTIEAIRERAVYSDDYRRELGLPYADSDIHQLLAEVERLLLEAQVAQTKARDPSAAEARLERMGRE
jgi:hypothetical protein